MSEMERLIRFLLLDKVVIASLMGPSLLLGRFGVGGVGGDTRRFVLIDNETDVFTLCMVEAIQGASLRPASTKFWVFGGDRSLPVLRATGVGIVLEICRSVVGDVVGDDLDGVDVDTGESLTAEGLLEGVERVVVRGG